MVLWSQTRHAWQRGDACIAHARGLARRTYHGLPVRIDNGATYYGTGDQGDTRQGLEQRW